MSQSKSRTLQMTEGNPITLLLQFAAPMLLGNLFQQCYNIADSSIVGKMLGADALAAVGATSSATFLFFALCNGIGNGGGIVTAQAFGAGDRSQVKKCIANTAYIMLIMPVIVGTIAFIASEYMLRFLKTPESIICDSITYMRVMCVGVVCVSIYNFISSMLRALGDSRTPLYFLIVSCVINVVLDILFVKMGMGVFGAGLATIISQLLSGVSCIIFAFKTNDYFVFTKEDIAVDFKIICKVIKLGVPLSLQFAMISISCMALQRVVNGFGETAVAAFTATSRVEQVIHQPYQTLGAALSTFSGQNYGAHKMDRVKSGMKKGMLMMAIFTACMIPIMQFFSGQIIHIFVDEPEVIEMGAKALRITSIFYVFLGIIYVVRGVLNGLGDSFFALLNGIVEVIGRFTVPIFLTSIATIGVWGIWWSTGAVWFISGFTAWLRYRFRKIK